MFDISALKEMKLSELQEIAKVAKTIKITGVKKDVLINQILDFQAKNQNDTPAEDNTAASDNTPPKRTRIVAEKKPKIAKTKAAPAPSEEVPAAEEPYENTTVAPSLFEEEKPSLPAEDNAAAPVQKERKVI